MEARQDKSWATRKYYAVASRECMLNPSNEGFSCHFILLTVDPAVVKLSKLFHRKGHDGLNWPCVATFFGGLSILQNIYWHSLEWKCVCVCVFSWGKVTKHSTWWGSGLTPKEAERKNPVIQSCMAAVNWIAPQDRSCFLSGVLSCKQRPSYLTSIDFCIQLWQKQKEC